MRSACSPITCREISGASASRELRLRQAVEFARENDGGAYPLPGLPPAGAADASGTDEGASFVVRVLGSHQPPGDAGVWRELRREATEPRPAPVSQILASVAPLALAGQWRGGTVEPMSVQVAAVSRYRFTVPSAWSLRAFPADGALHAVLAAPTTETREATDSDADASAQLEVVDGLGSSDVLEQYLHMHRASGVTLDERRGSAQPDRVELSLRVFAGPRTVQRRVHAAQVAGDLVSVVLTWADPLRSADALKAAAAYALDSAITERTRETNPV